VFSRGINSDYECSFDSKFPLLSKNVSASNENIEVLFENMSFLKENRKEL
jgi:hypothetical protein